MPKKRKNIQAPCNDCGRKTDHLILKTHTTSGHDQEAGVHWSTSFDMLECCGCHFISLRRTFDFSEYEDFVVEYFPPPISRRKPAWEGELMMNVRADSPLPDLLKEVYSALHADSRRLATMGARALLDVAIMDSVGDVGRFDQKLDALKQKGFLGEQQHSLLEAALDAGNAAAHRGHCPSAKQLNHVMDIVENVLQQIYVLPHSAAELQRSTPPRNKATK